MTCNECLIFHLLFCEQQQEQDPTNLYISNLPLSVDEKELENMLQPFGQVVSTRILRDYSGNSRGVGFARSVTEDWILNQLWKKIVQLDYKLMMMIALSAAMAPCSYCSCTWQSNVLLYKLFWKSALLTVGLLFLHCCQWVNDSKQCTY